MKAYFTILIFLSLNTFEINAECTQLLDRYYSCKNLNFTNESSGYVTLAGKLNDTFYRNTLSKVQSFGSAMNLFRRIYTELNDCKTEICKCAKLRNDGSHFNAIFTNSGHFGYFKLLTSQIKAKYHLRAFNKTEFEVNYFEYPLVLSEFCFNNDFSINMLHYFNETGNCVSQSNFSKKCFDDNLSEELKIKTGIEDIPNKKLEDYTKCLLSSVHCSTDVKRFTAVNLIASYPKIIKGSLENYIESLLMLENHSNPSFIG